MHHDVEMQILKSPLVLDMRLICEFADWCHDRNPIHVDTAAGKRSAFGGNIAHGALTTILSLSQFARETDFHLNDVSALSIEFRHEIRPEIAYPLHLKCSENECEVSARAGTRTHLSVQLKSKLCQASLTKRTDWVEEALNSGNRVDNSREPLVWRTQDFVRGQVFVGLHTFRPMKELENFAKCCHHVPDSAAQTLGLCSYLIGMRIPGLNSLFTRLDIEFKKHLNGGSELAYRLVTKEFDPDFRVLELELTVATTEGELIAQATLHSYVRFDQLIPSANSYQDRLKAIRSSFQGKRVLVCGASRGLGAEIAAAFGSLACNLVLTSRSADSSTDKLCKSIEESGGSAKFVAGDLANPTFCSDVLNWVKDHLGGLDILVLNACGPMQLINIAELKPGQINDYVSHNLALSLTPLVTFLPSVVQSHGAVVAISSSAVTELPAGFGDYVAVKMALEGAMRTAAIENPSTSFVIVRPSKLATSWNDTPARAVGCLHARVVAAKIAESTATSRTSGNLSTVEEFGDDWSSPQNAREGTGLAVTLCSTFTLDTMSEHMRRLASKFSLNVICELTPYAQVLQQLLDPTSTSSTNKGVSFFFVRISDWLRELQDAQQKSNATLSFLQSLAKEYVEAFRVHRLHALGSSILIICPSGSLADLADHLFAELESFLREEISQLPGARCILAHDHHEQYEIGDQFFDPLRDKIAHIPYTEEYLAFLSTIVLRNSYQRLLNPTKVVVVDCDNTLWKGIVGEIGSTAIELAQGNMALQRKLVELSENGVLVCLCSKNEESDVWRVFEDRQDMVLRRDHIVATRINWLPKSANIQELARDLNLGLDSFLFIDDNPIECAEVRSNCPAVTTLQWPIDEVSAKHFLNHTWDLDLRVATVEDRKRTQLYREEYQRKQVQSQSNSFQQFLESLKLEIKQDLLVDDDVSRASQLTLRTNQFNFTTIRRSESEINQLIKKPDFVCKTVRVSDRFGDYGLVGFWIAQAVEDHLVVDSFLLSCRVLGRGVEYEMARNIGKFASDKGLNYVCWKHIPTERNTPAKLFMQKVVAQQAPASDEAWECRVDPLELCQLKLESENTNDSEELTPQPANYQMEKGRDRERRQLQIVDYIRDQLLADATGDSEKHFDSTNSTDIDAFVHGVFAKALRKPENVLRNVDRLDAIGCDSLRIVEITVLLSRQYPWLPKTLLFEHKSISEIVKNISSLAHGKQASGALQKSSRPSIESDTNSEIAIVGMAVHCAGSKDLAQFWELIKRGDSAVKPVPSKRSGFVGQLDDSRQHFAGLIDDVCEFDAEFFGLSPREAEYIDPQFRLLLQTAWHALEDAGNTSEVDESTGVFVGAIYSAYSKFANTVAVQNGSVYRCWEGFGISNRISQLLGCHGPSLTIDTACSSAATALHYACAAIQSGDCESAIVAGVNLIIDPNQFVQLGRLGILSSSGRCVPFGAGADGTVLGEGAVAIVLRRLGDAKKRGERVYGIIKGTGVSTGTGAVGFTAPNPVAQAKAARQALRSAAVDPRTVSYVETHGTGTELGDPIEIRGLELAYCDESLFNVQAECEPYCKLGSLKPNVGHLEAGAGLLAVAKVALQLHHRQIVPSITASMANPAIDFDNLPFRVSSELVAWDPKVVESNGQRLKVPRRGGVNSFGIGGANVHILLEEAPSNETSATMERTNHLVALSAPNRSGLTRQLDMWSAYLQSPNVKRGDSVYSQNVGRKKYSQRAALIVSETTNELIVESIVQPTNNVEDGDCNVVLPKLAFLFSGQGAQFPCMLQTLYNTSPVFKSAMDLCFELFQPLLPKSLRDVWFDPSALDTSLIHQTLYTQPALFTVEYSLAKLWQSWGVFADVIMGHSIGEIAAYCVAEGCSLEDAVLLVAKRASLMHALPQRGAMMAVQAGESQVKELLSRSKLQVDIAALNSPAQTILSGAEDEIRKIELRCAETGIRTTMLNVSHAFHSTLMEPMLVEFQRSIQELEFHIPKINIISTVLGTEAPSEMATPEYWVEQVRKPVRCLDGMTELGRLQVSHYLEIGPQPIMLGLGQKCLAENLAVWLPSTRKNGEDWQTILSSLGRLYVDGVDVDWKSFDAPYQRRRTIVPGYDFERRRTWLAELDSWSDWQINLDSNKNKGNVDCAQEQAYHLNWVEAHRVTESSNPPQAWLLLCSEAMAKKIAPVCQQLGHICETIHIVSDTLDSIEQAVHQEIGDIKYDRVIWLDEPTPINNDNLAFVLSAKLHFASQLTKLAGAGGKSRKVWILTQRAFFSKDDLAVTSAGLWGFAAVAAMEYPDTWGGIVDYTPDLCDIREALAEVTGTTNDDQVAFVDRKRFVRRLSVVADKNETSRKPLRQILEGSSVMITGGSGGIGKHLTRWLISTGVKEVLLLSRRGVDDAQFAKELTTLQEAGLAVHSIRCDVTNLENILDCVGHTRLPLRAIFHAAGIDWQKPIGESRIQDIQQVLSAKVSGTVNLFETGQRLGVELFVCFSSISSVWGAPNRSVYAAANSFLDAYCQSRNSDSCHSLSLNFGPWSEGGMADKAALNDLARLGNFGLAPEKTLPLIAKAIESEGAQVVIAKVDWQTFIPIVAARRSKPLFEYLLSTPESSPGFVSSWGSEVNACADPGPAIEKLLKLELGKLLRLKQWDEISSTTSLYELGLDSLAAAELLSLLERQTGQKLRQLFIGEPSISGLVQKLIPVFSDMATPKRSQRTTSLTIDDVASVLIAELKRLFNSVDIQVTTPLKQLGMDSLLVTEYANRIRSRLKLARPPRVMDFETLGALAEELAHDQGSQRPEAAVNYDSELDESIEEFCHAAWPNRPPALALKRWKWIFLDSASRLNVPPRVWLYRKAGHIVGHMGAQFTKLKIGDTVTTTAWFVETMVLPQFRDQGIGTDLILQSQEEMPFNLSLGQTEDMRRLMEKIGWVNVGPLYTYMLPLNATRVLRSKVSTFVAPFAATALRVRGQIKRTKARGLVADAVVRKVVRFDTQHDALWEQVSAAYTCATCRDTSFLNWKYVDQPGQEFLKFDVLTDLKLIGSFVISLHEPDSSYLYRRTHIVDIVVGASMIHVATVLANAVNQSRMLGADAVFMHVSHPKIQEILEALGFIPREATRHLLVANTGDAQKAQAFDLSNWLITQGDSDIDRPF